MESNDKSLDEHSHQHDVESPPVVEVPLVSRHTKRENGEGSKRSRMSQSRSQAANTLASEKDPRRRHTTQLSMTRRPSLHAFSSPGVTGESARQMPSSQHEFEDIDLQESAGNQHAFFGELDKFGNKRLSAGYHSRRLSRGGTCTEYSSSSIRSTDCSLGDSQPGAYSVERDDGSVDSDLPSSRIGANGVGLIEATLVEAYPKPVPIVEASPMDDATVPTRKASAITCRGILCLLVIMVIVVTPLFTGLVISMSKQSSQTNGPLSRDNDVTNSPTAAPTVGELDEDIPENTETMLPAPTVTSYSMQGLENEPSLAPITLSPPADQSTSSPAFQPSVEPAITTTTTHVPSSLIDTPKSVATDDPTITPSSDIPSTFPSASPSKEPSAEPSSFPSHRPSSTPSTGPSAEPSSTPTLAPTSSPTASPTLSSTPGRPGNSNGNGNGKFEWVWSEEQQKWIRVRVCDGR